MTEIWITPSHLGDDASPKLTENLAIRLRKLGWDVKVGLGKPWSFDDENQLLKFEKDFATYLNLVAVMEALEEEFKDELDARNLSTVSLDSVMRGLEQPKAGDFCDSPPNITPVIS